VVNELEIPWNLKRQPYSLGTVEGSAVQYDDGKVQRETAHIQIAVQSRRDALRFDITNTGDHPMILGIPWLRKHNPTIDWITGQLRWAEPPEQDPQSDSASEESPRQGPSSETTTLKLMVRHQRKKDRRHKPAQDPRTSFRILAFIKKREASDPDDYLAKVPEEYHEFAKLFQPELDTKVSQHSRFDHEIPLKEGTFPHFMKMYPLNEEKLEALKEYLEEHIQKGHIRESTSPAGYPILFVPKKAGSKKRWRLVVDYRRLNEISIKNRRPLPLIGELRDRTQGAKWFTALDLKSAYNLVRIKEGDEWKTAFRTRYGHYEYLVMPQGLTNAPATFQTLIDDTLRECLDRFVVAYLDDVLIYSKTLEKHKEHVRTVLQKLMDANLLVEPDKSFFHVQEVDFLGCTIGPGWIKMQESRVKAIRDWPEPKNVTDVRSFLGYMNFCRKFIQGYSDIARPLTNLTRKDTTFHWESDEKQAFQDLKRRAIAEPILREPDPTKPYEVEADASDKATGGLLGQRDEDGNLHPIAFFSKKFTDVETRYPVYDKELKAIVDAFREWRVYLAGAKHPITVYSDHKNLTHFAEARDLNPRQSRWVSELAEYDFKIIYRKGTQNVRADALSRRPDHMGEIREDPRAIFSGNHQQLQLGATTILTKDDTWTKRLRDEASKEGHEFGTRNKSKIYLPRTLRKEAIQRIHESPIGGHQGIAKTLDRVRREYEAPDLLKLTKEVITECDICNRAKTGRHKPYGKLQPLPVPEAPWTAISWDLIVKLPPSTEPLTRREYDSIWVIIDRLTKYAYFLPFNESHDAKELAYAFTRNVVANHGLPKEIVTDRGTTFASKFWKELTSMLGIDHRLSTAFHPETNGQTERTNQTLETYLRSYVNYHQDDWVQWLPLAQIAYNSAKHESIGTSPFMANYGQEPTSDYQIRPSQIPEATIHASDLQGIHEQLKDELHFVRTRMKHHADKRRSTAPTFQEGDKVYLARRNIQTKRPSDKLDFKRLGPFKIARKLSGTNYELSLPGNTRTHPRFHVSLLEPAPRNAPLAQTFDVEDTTEYEVEAILDHRGQGQQTEYLVKWKGYDSIENSWEPIKNLRRSQRLLRKYWKDRG